eukprot:scaffold2663_cov256-Pinguiococcus_pyrenoidosus.AAC.10
MISGVFGRMAFALCASSSAFWRLASDGCSRYSIALLARASQDAGSYAMALSKATDASAMRPAFLRPRPSMLKVLSRLHFSGDMSLVAAAFSAKT